MQFPGNRDVLMPFHFSHSFQEGKHSLIPFQFRCCFLEPLYLQHVVSLKWLGGGALSTQKLKTFCWESRAIKGSFFNAGVAQNIALCASPTARNSVFLISALPVHSDSFLPNLLWKMLVLGQNRWIDIIVFLSVVTVNQIRLVILWTVFELY